MIEVKHEIINLNSFKKTEDIKRELDNFASNGFIIRKVAGKQNHILILQRVVEYPDPQQYYQPQQQFQQQQQIPQAELSPPVSDKRQVKKKEVMFPNAVYR